MDLYELEAEGEAWTRPRAVSIVPAVNGGKADRPRTLSEAFREAKRLAGWHREIPGEEEP